eukprot:3041811-Pleurochrysis_carterae.AAC.1
MGRDLREEGTRAAFQLSEASLLQSTFRREVYHHGSCSQQTLAFMCCSAATSLYNNCCKHALAAKLKSPDGVDTDLWDDEDDDGLPFSDAAHPEGPLRQIAEDHVLAQRERGLRVERVLDVHANLR